MADEIKPAEETKPAENPMVSGEMVGEIKTTIKDQNPEVRIAVVDHYVKTEIDNRVALVIKGMDNLKELNREMKKIQKPGVEEYDENGKVIRTAFTKEGSKAIKEHKEKIAKAEKALTAAVNDGDYELLKKVTGGK